MNILAELRNRFRTALAGLVDDPEPYVAMVRPAQDPRFGDFQANCAMPLAKQLGGKPRDAAADLVARLDVADLCDPPEIAGPGFINLRLRDDWLAQQTSRVAADQQLGVAYTKSPRKYVVDFSAPNVAKPMHVGHLRSTVIGDCLCRVLRFLGHEVTGDNHIGDWGTQFGMIIYGYKHFRDEAGYAREPVAELARLYRLVNQLADYHEAVAAIPALEQQLEQKRAEVEAAEAQSATATGPAGGSPVNLAEPKSKARQTERELKKLRSDLSDIQNDLAAARRKREAVESDTRLKSLAEAHPAIAEAARRETAKLHAGDAENLALWHEFMPRCLAALQGVYERLDVRFDTSLGESFYQPLLADVVADLRSRGIARESEGAICVFVEGNEAPFIVQKSDGAYTYATTDLATIKYRVEQLGADAIVYVVDARQSEHFELLFEVAQRWGLASSRESRAESREPETRTTDHGPRTTNGPQPSTLNPQPLLRHVSFGTILGDDRRPFKTRAGDTIGLESLLDEAVSRARRIVDENDDSKLDAAEHPAPELDDEARQAIAEIVGIGGIKYADLRHNRESDYVFSWEKMLALTGDTATYMQYAYARIRGIERKRKSRIPPGDAVRAALASALPIPGPIRLQDASIRLKLPPERALALQLCRFCEAVEGVVADYRPNVLTEYLFATANAFSTFYQECPVLQEPDDTIRESRLMLCDVTARVLAQGLFLLGIRTSERM